jgi:hypothetical protein
VKMIEETLWYWLLFTLVQIYRKRIPSQPLQPKTKAVFLYKNYLIWNGLMRTPTIYNKSQRLNNKLTSEKPARAKKKLYCHNKYMITI